MLLALLIFFSPVTFAQGSPAELETLAGFDIFYAGAQIRNLGESAGTEIREMNMGTLDTTTSIGGPDGGAIWVARFTQRLFFSRFKDEQLVSLMWSARGNDRVVHIARRPEPQFAGDLPLKNGEYVHFVPVDKTPSGEAAITVPAGWSRDLMAEISQRARRWLRGLKPGKVPLVKLDFARDPAKYKNAAHFPEVREVLMVNAQPVPVYDFERWTQAVALSLSDTGPYAFELVRTPLPREGSAPMLEAVRARLIAYDPKLAKNTSLRYHAEQNAIYLTPKGRVVKAIVFALRAFAKTQEGSLPEIQVPSLLGTCGGDLSE